jgi:hypothetical protein
MPGYAIQMRLFREAKAEVQGEAFFIANETPNDLLNRTVWRSMARTPHSSTQLLDTLNT